MRFIVFALVIVVGTAGCVVDNHQPDHKITLTNHLESVFVDMYFYKDGVNFKYLQSSPGEPKTLRIPDGSYTWNVVADDTLSGKVLINETGSMTIDRDAECVVEPAGEGYAVTWK